MATVTRMAYFPETGEHPTPIYRRSELSAGTRLAGPVIVEQADTTTVVYPGQHCTIDDAGALLIHTGIAP